SSRAPARWRTSPGPSRLRPGATRSSFHPVPHFTHRALLAAVLALAALITGCPEKKQAPAPSQGGSASAENAERLSPQRSGVKVPLPQGWSALVASDGSFQSGPPGRPVLRVDV